MSLSLPLQGEQLEPEFVSSSGIIIFRSEYFSFLGNLYPLREHSRGSQANHNCFGSISSLWLSLFNAASHQEPWLHGCPVCIIVWSFSIPSLPPHFYLSQHSMYLSSVLLTSVSERIQPLHTTLVVYLISCKSDCNEDFFFITFCVSVCVCLKSKE